MPNRLAMTLALVLAVPGSAMGQQQPSAEGAFASAQRELVQRQAALSRLTIPERGQEFVEASAVRDALLASKFALVDQLAMDEYAGLRAYAERFYPTEPPLDTVHWGPNRVPVTSTEDATYAFAGANAFLGRLAEAGSRAMDLRVTSAPAQAAFRIEAEGGGSVRATATDDDLKNLYRGLYTYTVTRNGYKTVKAPLNLIDEDGRVLVCRLVKATDAADATPCRLQ